MACTACPRGTFGSEERQSSCEKCVIAYHIGESTTAKTGTVSKTQCLAPLWNYLVLGYIIYLLGGVIVWHALKTYRDWQAEKGDGTAVITASTPTESSEEEQQQELTFFQYAKAYFSDLLLRHPELMTAKVLIGRMFMVTDIGSDVLLVTSLFANQAGESDELVLCALSLNVVVVDHSRTNDMKSTPSFLYLTSHHYRLRCRGMDVCLSLDRAIFCDDDLHVSDSTSHHCLRRDLLWQCATGLSGRYFWCGKPVSLLLLHPHFCVAKVLDLRHDALDCLSRNRLGV